MGKLPENVAAEIASKRAPDAEEQPEETPKDAPKDAPKEPLKDDKPETKKGEAAKPKNGQSIAQVAEAADTEDEGDDDDEEDHDGDQKTDRKKRSSIFREFLDVKRELKDQRKVNKQMSKQYQEVAGALTDLIDVVKDLKGNKTAQKDEIEEFAEQWGLDKEGTKALVGVLEKRLSTKFKPTKGDDEDEDDDEDEEPLKTKKKSETKKNELDARKIELAIEGEYEDYLDSYPQVKGKINLKAIKRYIIGDDENLAKSFSTIVDEMYPGILANGAGTDGAPNLGDGDDGDKPDFNDPKVLARLEKDPKLKEKYHDDLISRVKGIRR